MAKGAASMYSNIRGEVKITDKTTAKSTTAENTVNNAEDLPTAHREYTVIHFGMEQNRFGLEANSLYKEKIKINLPSHFHSTPSCYHYNWGIFFHKQN